MTRYDRQRRVGAAGRAADDRLASLRVLLVGAGGIGAPLAIGLVRAGVGALTIIDPDGVSESDLSRQPLYFPEDALAGRPKAEAAVRELLRIGGRTRLEGRAISFTPRNAAGLVEGTDLVVDATDHLPAREWIDAACRAAGVPWIHTAAIGAEYVVLPFLTPGPPCFRCYIPASPPVDLLGTCESVGVLPVATALAAQHAIAAIVAWLRGEPPEESGTRSILRGRVGTAPPRRILLRADPECPGCSGTAIAAPAGTLRLLCGKRRAEVWVGLDTVEVRRRLAAREWRIVESVDGLRAELGDEVITLTPDGCLIYGPAEDLELARRRLLEVLGPDVLL